MNQIKLKAFAQQRKPSTKQKDNILNEERYLQMVCLLRVNIQNI